MIADNHVYNWVVFYPETLKFFLAAFKFYQQLLEAELAEIKGDPDLSAILGEEMLQSFQITKEIERIQRGIAWLEKSIKESQPAPIGFAQDISHGTIRFLKSVGMLYLNHLTARRDHFANKKLPSQVGLRALDTRLAEFSETLKSGVFEKAEPTPLLVEDIPEATIENKPEEARKVQSPLSKIASTIELLDTQLRKRCLDLYNTFSEGNQSDRFDTIISEATRILEDRIRHLSGAGPTYSGLDLMSFAFSGNDPKLKLSELPDEQAAAHLLFRGAFGFIRNPFHHRLMGHVEKERVIQILGLIDYLLYLAESAQRQLGQNISADGPNTP